MAAARVLRRSLLQGGMGQTALGHADGRGITRLRHRQAPRVAADKVGTNIIIFNFQQAEVWCRISVNVNICEVLII